MNIKTLLYWHKLENFYPYILQDQHNEKIKQDYDFSVWVKWEIVL